MPNSQFQLPIVPAVVCAVFSVEIGFKAIILSEGGAASGHELARLFKKISPVTQNLILREVGLDLAAFNTTLNSISNAFVKWRYIYEKDSAQVDINFVKKLAIATQKVAASA